jgi:hypothetical protein
MKRQSSLLGLWFAFVTFLANANEASHSFFVRAVSVNGLVRVGNKAIQPGEKVVSGSVISTDKTSSAKLLYPAKSLLDVGPETRFIVKEISHEGGKVELSSGMVRALIKKKLERKNDFIIQTKGSVFAVRGTEFIVQVDEKSNKPTESLTVVEGLVDLVGTAGGAPLSISAGEQIQKTYDTSSRTVASQPQVQRIKLESGSIAKVVEQAKVQDQSFIQAVDVNAPASGGQASPNQTLNLVASNYVPPPITQKEEVGKLIEAGKPPPQFRPPEPNAMQQLNPEIADRIPVKVVVTFQ